MLALAGCTSLAPMEPAERLYSGRFSAITSSGARQDNLSGRFTLAIRRSGMTLDLASVLGNTMARMHTDGVRATLTAPQADGSLRTWEGTSPEALAQETLGWTLPVSGLADWIEARAVPTRPSQRWPAEGPVQRIEQDGWTIEVLQRFDDSMAPRLLGFKRPGTDAAPAISLRLAVDAGDSRGAEPRTSQSP